MKVWFGSKPSILPCIPGSNDYIIYGFSRLRRRKRRVKGLASLVNRPQGQVKSGRVGDWDSFCRVRPATSERGRPGLRTARGGGKGGSGGGSPGSPMEYLVVRTESKSHPTQTLRGPDPRLVPNRIPVGMGEKVRTPDQFG